MLSTLGGGVDDEGGVGADFATRVSPFLSRACCTRYSFKSNPHIGHSTSVALTWERHDGQRWARLLTCVGFRCGLFMATFIPEQTFSHKSMSAAQKVSRLLRQSSATHSCHRQQFTWAQCKSRRKLCNLSPTFLQYDFMRCVCSTGRYSDCLLTRTSRRLL